MARHRNSDTGLLKGLRDNPPQSPQDIVCLVSYQLCNITTLFLSPLHRINGNTKDITITTLSSKNKNTFNNHLLLGVQSGLSEMGIIFLLHLGHASHMDFRHNREIEALNTGDAEWVLILTSNNFSKNNCV